MNCRKFLIGLIIQDDPNKNPEPPKPDNLSELRRGSINAIKAVLAQDPKLTNDDLSSSN